MLAGDSQLSSKALSVIQDAETRFLSPITFFEIGQKVRLGKWPDMERHVDQLVDLANGQKISSAALTPSVALLASRLAWSHRDPFDRILAATAIQYRMTLISADVMFDTLAHKHLKRVW